MKIDVIWKSWDNKQVENILIEENNKMIKVNSVIIGINNGVPYRILYEINCDLRWRITDVAITKSGVHEWSVRLFSNGNGTWKNENGEQVQSLNGCKDIDINATPFTNTIPINRLGLKEGMYEEIKVAYIDVFNSRLSSVKQRYTCLETNSSGSKYKYENLESNYRIEFYADKQGLIIDYPNAFKRESSVIYP